MGSYSTQFTEQIGSSNEIIDVLIEYGQSFDNDDFNDIKVTLSLNSGSNSGTEDMIGVAFDINNDATSGLQIVDINRSTSNGTLSTFTPSVVIGANQVSDDQGYLNPGFNISGGGVQEPYDVGIKFSDEGSGEGIVQSASFVIKAGTNLEKSLLENTDWYIRLQSTDGGNDSAKTGGTIGTIPDFTPTPDIDVEKYVSVDGGATWVDADSVTGPYLLIDRTDPQFKFVVQNTGNVDLTGVTLTDSDFNIDTTNGDKTIDIGNLAANDDVDGGSDQYIFTFTGATWQAGQHTNTATTEGTYNETTVSDSDDANYFGADPKIAIDKVTTIGDQTGDGLQNVALGSAVRWTYTVTNTGNVALSNVSVDDDQLASANDPIFREEISGNDDLVFDPGEIWEYTATGTVTEYGSYSNIGTASGSYTDSAGNTSTVTATNDSSYSTERGLGKTPGYWKQSQKFQDWLSPYTNQNQTFSGTFGVGTSSSGQFQYPSGTSWFTDSLLGALSAQDQTGSTGQGLVNQYGNVRALGRAATAGLLNAASDELLNPNAVQATINYIIDPGRLSATSIVGGNQDKLDAILDTLSQVDLNSDLRIGSTEVIKAVQDAFGVETTGSNYFVGATGVNSLATALDAMNNMAGG
jgi:hypothetical protein